MSDTICTRDGCQIASNGKCLEGFEPPSTCPYLTASAGSTPGAESPETSPFVSIPDGEALTETQASEVTREGVTRVVVLAGPVDSGKTTILTSLFEAFQEAPFGNFLFAGSRTLVGFERRCHDARIESGQTAASTVHTPVTDSVEFLHLQLASASPGLLNRQNLLLSDVSGERFRALRDSTDAVRRMRMLHRVDHLCIVVDGAKLADPNQRQSARTDARMLLRSLNEAKVLSQNCRAEIVFSKWDLVLAHPDQKSLMPYIQDTKKALIQQATNLAELRFFEIAARPENTKVPFAFGLPTLLRSWLEEPAIPSRARLFMPSYRENAREVSRFVRTVAETQRLGDLYDVRWV